MYRIVVNLHVEEYPDEMVPSNPGVPVATMESASIVGLPSASDLAYAAHSAIGFIQTVTERAAKVSPEAESPENV